MVVFIKFFVTHPKDENFLHVKDENFIHVKDGFRNQTNYTRYFFL